MKRFAMNRHKAARKFSRHAQRTKAANIAPPPNRGGYRF